MYDKERNVAGKACTGRLIAMATEEMTKHADVVPQIQKPCSLVLVALGSRFSIANNETLKFLF